MTSASNEHTSGSDAAINRDDAAWEVPTSAEKGVAESTDAASAPDASPLLDEPAGGSAGEAPSRFWNEGPPVSGATANSRLASPPEQPAGE